MNKIVKQISEQACEYANETWKPRVASKVPGKIWEEGYVDWFEQYDAKFAELIVQICANIVRNSSMPDAYSEACLQVMADELKEQFGFGVEP